ncbi:IFT52 protein, partial [Polyodon spathula]|nr:IFT52 protein [Polyodon spathula]
MEKDQRNTIVLNASKREKFTASSGYKSLQKKLKMHWKVQRGDFGGEAERSQIVDHSWPREKFTVAEFEVLKRYLDSGGNVLVMLGEGGELKYDTNINFLLEEFGIMVNSGFPSPFESCPRQNLNSLTSENFSSEKVRLAELSNKCTDDDLEFYVRKCGDILGVTSKLNKEQRDAKHILEHIIFQVVEFKKLNQEHYIDTTEAGFSPF